MLSSERAGRRVRRAVHRRRRRGAAAVRRGVPGAGGGHRGRARHRHGADARRGHGAGAVRGGRPARAGRGAGRARARRGRVERALGAAGDPAATGRAGAAGCGRRAGLLPVPAARAGYEEAGRQAGAARRRIAIVWLDNPPANSLAPAVGRGPGAGVGRRSQGRARAMVLASANPALFCAGADIKAFTTWDAESGRAHLARDPSAGRASGSARRSSRSPPSTGWRSAAGARSRWRATSGSRARRPPSASPRSTSGIIPGFGGTQRLPRLVGPAKALEMNLLGEPISAVEAFEAGLVNHVVDDHELFDTALAWGAQGGRPGAAGGRADQARLVRGGPRRGLAAERDGFMTRVRAPRTPARGSAPSSRSARRSSRGVAR